MFDASSSWMSAPTPHLLVVGPMTWEMVKM